MWACGMATRCPSVPFSDCRLHATKIAGHSPHHTCYLTEIDGRCTLFSGDAILYSGRLLLPAFADSHVHLATYALARQRMDLSNARSAEEVATTVAQQASNTLPGRWLRGHGWDRNVWRDSTLPTKVVLDAAAREYYRRVVVPYEEKKCSVNGDVYGEEKYG